MRLGEPDASGRRRPIPVEGSEATMDADVVVLAIGLRPATGPFRQELAQNKDETLRVDEETLQTSIPWVFAGGDAVSGPSMIVNAIGYGKRAALCMDRYLRGDPLSGVTVDYTIGMPGVILDQGQAAVNGGTFSFTYDPATLNQDFPNLDLLGRDKFGPGLSDTIFIGLLLQGDDGSEKVYRAATVTLQGEQVFVLNTDYRHFTYLPYTIN